MYKVIHVDKSWIVCDGQVGLIAFESRSIARRIAHDAEELLRTKKAAEHKLATTIPATAPHIDEMVSRDNDLRTAAA